MFHLFSLLALLLGVLAGTSPVHAARVIPVDADGATVSTGTSGLCVGCSVSGASRAIDADLTNQATITLPLGVGTSAYIDVQFPSAQPAVGRAGFLMTDGGGLVDVTLLGGITLTTYLGSDVRDTAGPSDIDARQLAREPGRSFVSFRPTQSFDRIRVTVAGAATLLRNVGVAYALHSIPVTQPELRYLKRSRGATASADVSSLCLGCTVTDVQNVVEQVAQFATMRIPVGVTGTTSITVDAGQPQDAGTRVGFRFTDEVGIVSATLLGGLRLTTYLGGVAQETATGSELKLTSKNVSTVSFTTTQPYDAVRLQAEGLVTLLTDLRVYAAFVVTRVPLDDAGAATGEADDWELAVDDLLGDDDPARADALTAASPVEALRLDAPVPNPTADRATIGYVLARDAAVHLAVVDALGREVGVLAAGWQAAGAHRASLPGGLAPGLYLVRLTDGAGSAVQRLTVAR